MFPVAILAGGLATRLRPLTEKIPKSLVEVAGRPFICWQLEWLKQEGVQDVVMCLGYLGDQVQALVGNGADFGLSVRYSFDGDKLLGTGGAVKRALPLLSEHFFVLYGDSYLLCSFSEVQHRFELSHRLALMTVMRNSDQWDKSNVLFQGGGLLSYNKKMPSPEMKHIDYGLGVMSSSVFDVVSDGHAVDLADIYQDLSSRSCLAGFEVQQRFYEIGSVKGIAELESYLLKKEINR